MKTSFSSAPDPCREAWASHLKDVFQTLGIPAGMQADHLAASIAMYCRKYHPGGLQSSDLKLLIVRAFCAIDDRPSARRVLESMNPHRRHVGRWLEILSELHHFPKLLPYFSLGIIRPADWAGAQLNRMWTLDFGRLILTDAERHEIMLSRLVRMLVETMFVFWDATGGEGILGLKNLSSITINEKSEGGQVPAVSGDWLDFIDDLFTRQEKLRNWHATPSLLNLDL
jgi:hypothetical protein